MDIYSISLISSNLILEQNDQMIGNVRANALPLQRPRICNSGVNYQIQILMFPSPHEETILETVHVHSQTIWYKSITYCQ